MRAGELIARLLDDERASCRVVELDALVDDFEEWLPAPDPVLSIVLRGSGHRCPGREIERLASGCDHGREPAPGSVQLLPPGLVQRRKPIGQRTWMQPARSQQPGGEVGVQERAMAARRDRWCQLRRTAALNGGLGQSLLKPCAGRRK